MSDDDHSGWQLTESDPGVFTELLKSLGVPLIVDDLYSLDSETLAALKPLHALIFLFKWVPTSDSDTGPGTSSGAYDPEFAGFFAHQVVNNACATLAVLNALGNIPSLPTGPQLGELLSFTTGMDPQTRGLGLIFRKKAAEDAYHFVVYLPVMGALYELDGLKPHAVRHSAYSEEGEGWIKVARETIEARINTYPMGSLEFSLLALRDDPLPPLQAQIKKAQEAGERVLVNELLATLTNENAKRERWAFENSLRRHNHVGLVHALIAALAKAGKLKEAEGKAKEAMKERIEKRKAQGGDMDED
ncbi:hypothetical protein H1R20_g5843, partial [Candolleomyces eurysporus]